MEEEAGMASIAKTTEIWVQNEETSIFKNCHAHRNVFTGFASGFKKFVARQTLESNTLNIAAPATPL